MARVLLAGDVAPFLHKAALCLREAGHCVDIVTRRTAALSLHLSSCVDRVHRVDDDVLWGHREGFADAVAAVASAEGSDVFFPTEVSSIRAWRRAARHPEIATVPLPSLETLETCDDKVRFAAAVDRAGLPQPDGWQVVADRASIPDDDRYPRMAKPPVGGGGVGVVVVESAAAVRRLVDTDASFPLLLQDYIPGADIDLSFLALAGSPVAWSIQQRASLDERHMSFVDDAEVRRVVQELLAELAYDGLGHIDLRIDERDGSIRLIELNPRVWGSVQYSMWMGINFPALAVDLALGVEPPPLAAPPVGRCTNVGLSLRGLQWRLRRAPSVPEGVPAEERGSFVTNHGDPLPFLAQRAGTIAGRVGDRLADLAVRPDR